MKNSTSASANIKRFSGIELLKIVGIFLICLSHAIRGAEKIITFSPSSNFLYVFFNILGYSGHVGNLIFIISTCFFLCGKTKFKLNKIINILLDSVFISIMIFITFSSFGFSFSVPTTIRQIFPSLCFNLWFISNYVIFYLLYPLLNKFLNKLNKKQHLGVLIFLFVFYSIPGLVFNFQITTSSFVGFIIGFVVVDFLKKYHADFMNSRRKNILGFILFFTFFIVLIILRNYISLTCPAFFKIVIFDEWNFLILLVSMICLFNVFNSLKFKNKVINYLSSCSLLVYCFHDNDLFRTIVRPDYFNFVLGQHFSLYPLWIMLWTVGTFVVGYHLSILYKETIQKFTGYLSLKLEQKILKNKSLDKSSNLKNV